MQSHTEEPETRIQIASSTESSSSSWIYWEGSLTTRSYSHVFSSSSGDVGTLLLCPFSGSHPPGLLFHSHFPCIPGSPLKGSLTGWINEAPHRSALMRCFSFSEGFVILWRWRASLWHSLFPASESHPAGQLNSKGTGGQSQTGEAEDQRGYFIDFWFI